MWNHPVLILVGAYARCQSFDFAVLSHEEKGEYHHQYNEGGQKDATEDPGRAKFFLLDRLLDIPVRIGSAFWRFPGAIG